MRSILGLLAFPIIMSGCAYVDVVATQGSPSVRGLRIYAPKALLIVNGSSVSSLVVPDCSKEYAVRFGSFLAKNDVTLDIANGMITKIDNKQDTTALPLKLVDAVTEAAKAGKSLGEAFSDKAEGGVQDRFGVYEFSCVNGGLTASSSITREGLLKLKTSTSLFQPPISDAGPTQNGPSTIPDK